MTANLPNPYKSTTSERHREVLAARKEPFAVLSLCSAVILAINLLSLLAIVGFALIASDPTESTLGGMLFTWVVFGVPASSLLIVLYCSTVDRYTGWWRTRLLIGGVCLIVWFSLAIFTIRSLRETLHERSTEFDNVSNEPAAE